MHEALERIAHRAKLDPACRFGALAHHLTEDFLRDTWQRLNRKGAPGVDHATAEEYAVNLDDNLKRLVEGIGGTTTGHRTCAGSLYPRRAIRRNLVH